MRRLAVLTVFFSSCAFDASAPPTANIACSGDSDCPSGFECRVVVGHCVSTSGDGAPPFIVQGTEVVVPSVGARDTRFTLRFLVNEPLASRPLLKVVDARGVTLAGLEDLPTENPLEFAWQFRADAVPAEGAAQTFVELTDASGNVATSIYGPRFVYDLTPPSLLPGSVTLLFRKAADNPVAEVSAINAATVAELAFTLTEPADEVVLKNSEPTLVATQVESAVGNHLRFELKLTGTPAMENVPITVTADLKDVHGNWSRDVAIPLDNLRADPTPPPRPADDGRLLLVRAAWGSVDGTPPGVFLSGAAGSYEPGITVRVTDANGAVLAQTVSDSLGGLGSLPLGPSDRDAVFTTAIDGAGNFTGPFRVRDVEWVASLVNKQAGDTQQNPHRVLLRPTTWVARDQPNTFEVAPRSGTPATIDGLASWVRRTPALARLNVRAATFDPNRGRIVALADVFNNPGGPITWEWTGEGWVTPATSDPESDGDPIPSNCQDMVFDPVRNVSVAACFGPTGGCETWEWNASSWKRAWADLSCAPLPTGAWRLLWLEQLGKVGLYAPGRDGLFAFDGVNWAQAVAVPGITAFGSELVAFDPQRQWLLQVSTGAGNAYVFDTQRDGGWLLTHADGGFPTQEPSMAWNASRGRVELVGRELGVWKAWSLAPDAGWETEPLNHTPMIFEPTGSVLLHDRARQRLLVLRRYLNEVLTVDELFSSPRGLELVAPGWLTSAPAARSGHGAAWLDGVGMVVMGGASAAGVQSDGWTWNGKAWKQLTSVALNPARRHAAVAAGGGRIVAYGGTASDGGTLGDAWELRNDGGFAALPASLDAGALLGPRTGATLCFDPVDQRFILAGGSSDEGGFVFGPMWDARLDGAEWTPVPTVLNTSYSQARRHLGSYFDPATARCRFGYGEAGNSGAHMTWAQWNRDAGQVELSNTQLGVSVYSRYGLAYDPDLAAPISMGGSQGLAAPTDALTRLVKPFAETLGDSDAEADGRPSPRALATLVRDPNRARSVLYGGEASGTTFNELWELAWSEQRPSALVSFNTAALALPASGTVVSARLSAPAQGVSTLLGSAVNTTRVEAWIEGRWVTVGTAASVTTAPTLAVPASAPLLDALLRGQRNASFRVSPSGTNAAQPASLSVGVFELRVRYQWNAP